MQQVYNKRAKVSDRCQVQKLRAKNGTIVCVQPVRAKGGKIVQAFTCSKTYSQYQMWEYICAWKAPTGDGRVEK